MARYRLVSICQIISGSTPKTGVQEYWNGDKKWITPAELSESDYIIYDTERKLTEAGVRSAGLTPLPKGTVILSSRAPIGKVAIAGCEMYCNQGFKNFVCSNIINNKYLYWYLRSKTDFLNSLGRGATFKEISKSIVADIELDIPELSEQSKRVAHLEKLQSIITSRRIQLAKLDELVKCRFIEMFGDPVANPMGWATKSMHEVAPHSPIEIKTEDNDIWLLNLDKIESHTGRVTEYVYNRPNEIGTSTCGFDNRHVLYSKLRPYLNKVVVPNKSGMATSELLALRPNEALNREFLAHLLRSDNFVGYISEKVAGAKMPRVSMDIFRSFPCILPPMPIQNTFADFVHRIDKLRIVIRQSLDEAQKLFDSLMQEYFD
ncbi:MAG: restriction endonuclease subunit S [Akkermansia sp.]|nr:restriction endonuclease subunit S [Akkermansia sp.]